MPRIVPDTLHGLYHEGNFLVLVFQIRNRGTERLSDFSKVTELQTSGLIPEPIISTFTLH
jgi:hypothetical protein